VSCGEEQEQMDGNDLKELRELVEFLKANGIAEFEMERPDLKVGLKFAGAYAAPAAAAPVYAAPAAAAVQGTAAAAAPAAAAAAPAEPSAEDGAHIVKSPIVGTFYAAPSPDAEPFAKVGDHVTVGKVLCIVEAMKLMNEIESDGAGEIVKVFVKSGQPVEYGQPLFAVK
jgi:acetyl-CoA carboxylase biotin carboxyl carrier protein